MLAPGDKAPAFQLADASEAEVPLSSFEGREVLVYFYPKARTPGCTSHARGTRYLAWAGTPEPLVEALAS